MPYDQVMSKWKSGTLKSGGSGAPVQKQKQAVAIMMSEKRKAEGGKSEYAKSPLNKVMSKVGRGY